MSKLPDWAVKISTMYSEGAMDIEIMAEMNWDQRTFDEYMKTDGFRKLVEMGRLKSKAFWISQTRKNLNNRQFNSQAYGLFMKNLFGWAEKQETNETKTPSMLSSVELQEEYKKVEAELEKLKTNESGANVTALKARGAREAVKDSLVKNERI